MDELKEDVMFLSESVVRLQNAIKMYETYEGVDDKDFWLGSIRLWIDLVNRDAKRLTKIRL